MFVLYDGVTDNGAFPSNDGEICGVTIDLYISDKLKTACPS